MLVFLANHFFIMLMLVIGTAFNIVWLIVERKSLGVKVPGALVLAFTHTIYGVFTVMIFAVIESWDFSVFGSLSIFGGVFFMPLYYYIVSKLLHRKVGEVFDIFVPCLLFTLMCARINCLYAGCCIGRVMFTNGNLTGLRWPTREAEIVLYFVLLVVFIVRIQKGKTQGDLYPIYLLTYGIIRFVIEFFRVSESTDALFHLAHLWSVISAIAGISMMISLQESRSKEKIRS